MKSTSWALLNLALVMTSLPLQGMYHWRKELESVQLLAAIKTAYEYDLPLEPFRDRMFKEFAENEDKTTGSVARQTVLSHAAREAYPKEFVEFLRAKGITDPVSQKGSPAVIRKKVTA